MPFSHSPRRAAGIVFFASLLAAQGLSAQAEPSVAAPPSVHGLIVRLKNAVPNEQLSVRVGASTREHTLSINLNERESARWSHVIDQAGLGGLAGRRAPARRPVGHDQQVLAFETPLSAREAEGLMARLAARPDVDWVEPNSRERRLQVAGSGQWWLKPVSGTDGNVLADRLRGVPGVQSAWVRGAVGAPSAVMAVLDTGIVPLQALSGRVLPGYDFVTESAYAADGGGRDADPADPGDFVSAADVANPNNLFKDCVIEDSSWHGTIIAGMLSASTYNGSPLSGIAWSGRVLPVRVAGKCGAEVADIADGMRWAAGLAVAGVPTNPNPAKVVNISFGGTAACGSAYQTAVNELQAKGVVVVAAAGNEHTSPTRPASCAGVVGVAALNRDGFKAHFSNFGSALAATGIATVAGDDGADPSASWNALADDGLLTVGLLGTTTSPGNAVYNYGYFGTSFSAPVVTGTIGLMLGVNPGLTYQQIVDGLRKTARPHVVSNYIAACSDANPGRCICTTATCGTGILDAEQAVLYAANPAAYVAPARTPAQINNTDVIAAVQLASQDRPANAGASTGSSGNSSGGGALSWAWLAALAAAATSLARSARVAHGGGSAPVAHFGRR
jgi:serine protease